MSKQDEFIQSIEGELTPEQAAQLLELSDDEGDTGGKPETGSEPGASTAKEEGKPEDEASSTEQDDDEPNEDELTPDNAVILAKDGKHTISFDKLVEAREAAKAERELREAAEAQAKAAMQELEALKQAAQERANAGEDPTKVDNQVAAAEAAIAEGVDPEIFGDFSEEALAKGIEKLVSMRVSAQVDAALKAHLEPLKERHQQDAAAAHYQAIYDAHPDADSIAESNELAEWIKSQPSFMQAACQNVLENGSSQEVIELFDRFKEETGSAQEPSSKPSPEDVKAAAKAAVAKAAKAEAPTSLSDIPGGKVGATSRTDAMADMDALELLGTMEDMDPEKIEQFLNRL